MQEVFSIMKDIPWWGWILIFLCIVAIADIFFNKKHTIQHNFRVATQNKWLQAGINVKEKAMRTNFYFTKFRKELLQICHASGYEHPCQFNTDDVDINLSDKNLAKTLATAFSYHKDKVNFTSVQELLDCPHLGGNLNLKKMRNIENAID